MSLAHTERLALVDTMVEKGPDAPTLCGTWTARDLAAHLVVRERRLDAAPGILLPPLSGYTRKVQDEMASTPWLELTEKVRTGPPIWSPYKIIDSVVNLGEFFVHHEDVRRGGAQWAPRQLPDDLSDALWKLTRTLGRVAYRSSPVTVSLRTPDGRRADFRSGKKQTVTMTAEPAELLLHAFGRDAVSIDFDGDAEAIAAVDALSRGF